MQENTETQSINHKLKIKTKTSFMPQFIIIHYHEIALKGKNRIFFEKTLLQNIKKALIGLRYDFVKRIPGRLIVKLNKHSEFLKIKVRLKRVFGIAYFCKAYLVSQKIENLQKDVFSLISEKKFETFKIETKRAKKEYPLTSQQINEKIGAYILENFKKKIKVDLKKPELTCFVEICNNYVFVYFDRLPGPGGLPVSVSGKVIGLISTGFDSPLASFKMMKRGAKVVFVHFHSYPYTSQASIENVKRLIEILTQYQFQSSLYLTPFIDIQKEIVRKTPSSLRVVLYRRMMFRIAQTLAQKEKAYALITGESLGQVASQTLENMRVTSQAVELPIFRPLIGEDKEEIIKQTKKVSTYKISSLPFEDCCSLFVPKRPVTRAKLSEVLKAEKKLDIEKLIKEAIGGTEILKFLFR